MCELDMNRERGRRASRAHREQARYAPRAHQAYVVQMKAESYFWNLIYIYLIFHYVSSGILMSPLKTMKTTHIAL